MAISKVQHKDGEVYYGTSLALTFDSNVTAGNLIIIPVGCLAYSAHTWSAGQLTKTAGTATIGTVALDASDATNTTNVAAVYSVPVTGTGSLTLTLASMPADTIIAMAVVEFSGVDTSASRLEDSDAVYNNSGVAPTSASLTSAGGAVFIGAVAKDYGVTLVPDSAFTSLATTFSADYRDLTYRIVTSGTTDAVSWTAPTDSAWAVAAGVYKAGASGPSAAVLANYYRMMRDA